MRVCVEEWLWHWWASDQIIKSGKGILSQIIKWISLINSVIWANRLGRECIIYEESALGKLLQLHLPQTLSQMNKWTVAWLCVSMVGLGHFSYSLCIHHSQMDCWVVRICHEDRRPLGNSADGSSGLWSNALLQVEECSISPCITWWL